ncbi:MAG TPA: type VI secretion system tube protein Hcp [Pyrinomonadaceae bacterium]|nr:type VI secretion system tube protein Hcp [Pyrinomonadaceae bacterium]
MKRLVTMAIAVFALSSSTLAAGDVNITISSNHGQIKTSAKEFRFSRSPRDLAGQTSGMAAAGQATGARGTSAARAGMKRASDPIIIVRVIDETSKFFQIAAVQGELLPAVLFEFTRTRGGQTEVYQTVRLTNAMVSSVKMLNGLDRPMEEVSFTFQKIEYQNKDGAAAATDNWRSN